MDSASGSWIDKKIVAQFRPGMYLEKIWGSEISSLTLILSVFFMHFSCVFLCVFKFLLEERIHLGSGLNPETLTPKHAHDFRSR